MILAVHKSLNQQVAVVQCVESWAAKAAEAVCEILALRTKPDDDARPEPVTERTETVEMVLPAGVSLMDDLCRRPKWRREEGEHEVHDDKPQRAFAA